jgi:hypothetical protein
MNHHLPLTLQQFFGSLCVRRDLLHRHLIDLLQNAYLVKSTVDRSGKNVNLRRKSSRPIISAG